MGINNIKGLACCFLKDISGYYMNCDLFRSLRNPRTLVLLVMLSRVKVYVNNHSQIRFQMRYIIC